MISLCPYLNPGAFHYIFSPLISWGREGKRGFGGHLVCSQSQPTASVKKRGCCLFKKSKCNQTSGLFKSTWNVYTKYNLSWLRLHWSHLMKGCGLCEETCFLICFSDSEKYLQIFKNTCNFKCTHTRAHTHTCKIKNKYLIVFPLLKLSEAPWCYWIPLSHRESSHTN